MRGSNVSSLRPQPLEIDVQTFQMVSTNHMPLYSPSPFGIRTIVVHINYSGIYPSLNSTCITLTALSHVSVSGYFYIVASHSHDLWCSDFIPDVPPALPDGYFLTAVAIFPTYGGMSVILSGCTNIGSGAPSSGHFL